jgi:Tol biopolymer transport system component
MKRSVLLLFLLALTFVVAFSVAMLQPQRLVYSKTTENNIYIPTVLKNYALITKIAFVSERDGNREIYLLNSDGTNLTRLTNNLAEDFYHSWSPDGMQIVYKSDQDGNPEIYKVNVDGSNPTRLTNNPSSESRPSWSPDGQRIAFISNRHGSSNYEIYVINSDGTGETRLTNNSTSYGYPTWSPDGTQLAFVGGGQIYVINSDGTGQSQITSKSDVYVYDIDWSPSGTQIAFRGEVASNQEIYVVNVNGTGLTNLTNSPSVDLTPKWSPNGAKIAYTCHFKLCVMNPDGSDLIELTDNSGQYPTWSPDGKFIVFSSDRDGNSEIYTIGSDGKNFTRLTNHTGTDWRPVWQP